MPRTSTATPARPSLDLCCFQGLTKNPHIDSFCFIPDPASLYNKRVDELLKEDLGHMRQFQRKVMSGGDGVGS